MSQISKLFLFSKDTDASETIRGFKFQELKTLEVWLHNMVHNIDEQIYCDYEEDIFQRNLAEFKSTFKQIKLYSSKNFSFKSEEIKKTIANFFMLFVNADYLADERLFIFETNTAIAAKREDNDTELLNKWVKNQECLPADLLKEIIQKLKFILDPYIEEQFHKKAKKDKEKAIETKSVYENLSEETWEEFAKSIRWNFDSISSENAITKSIQESRKLIRQLPYPVTSEEYDKVFDRLIWTVGKKSMGKSPTERILTNKLLELQLLNLGNKDDNSYGDSLDIWKDIKSIDYFHIGEFYQVLSAAKYCRRNTYLEVDSEHWLQLLMSYYKYAVTPRRFKREAIYEIIWLTLRPSLDSLTSTNLKGLEPLVLDYFSDFETFSDSLSIEDTLNLLNLITGSQKLALIEITDEKLNEWVDRFKSFLENCKSDAIDRNFYCQILEVQAFFYFNVCTLGYKKGGLNKAINYLEEIIKELPNAPLYSVSQLGRKINGVIDALVSVGIDDKFILLEDFSEKLLPFVRDRESNFSLAKDYTIRGEKFLHSTDTKLIFKTLDYFHKAKLLYQDDATLDALVLALQNIAQFYAAIEMNIAAKYYAILSAWICLNQNDGKLVKHIIPSFKILFYIDFKQGAWINAIVGFEKYINVRAKFNSPQYVKEEEELFDNAIAEISFIITLMPLISSQLYNFVEYKRSQWGEFYNSVLESLSDVILEKKTKVGLNNLVNSKICYPPVNDIGEKRTITWKVFDSEWHIQFKNNFIENSIGEEFAALLQVIQTEIAFKRLDFNFQSDQSINIKLEVVDNYKGPEEIFPDFGHIWKVYIPILPSKKEKNHNFHYANITNYCQHILKKLSQLSNKEFNDSFESLMKGGLADKSLTINAYQKAYRYIYSEEEFNEPMRDKFSKELLDFKLKEFSAFL